MLIDGDYLIFNSSFLRDGEDGGKNAAILLHDIVQRWAVENVIDCTTDVKVREICGYVLAATIHQNGFSAVDSPDTA